VKRDRVFLRIHCTVRSVNPAMDGKGSGAASAGGSGVPTAAIVTSVLHRTPWGSWFTDTATALVGMVGDGLSRELATMARLGGGSAASAPPIEPTGGAGASNDLSRRYAACPDPPDGKGDGLGAPPQARM